MKTSPGVRQIHVRPADGPWTMIPLQEARRREGIRRSKPHIHDPDDVAVYGGKVEEEGEDERTD